MAMVTTYDKIVVEYAIKYYKLYPQVPMEDIIKIIKNVNKYMIHHICNTSEDSMIRNQILEYIKKPSKPKSLWDD